MRRPTNNAVELKPYESWVDFAGNLKNEASIINFIAAYGLTHLITGETTIEGKRDAALTIIFGRIRPFSAVRPEDDRHLAPADRRRLPQRTGAWANLPGGVTTTGLDNVDLWIGGLAEEDPALRRHARLDLQLRLRDADGEPAERRPLLLPAAARRPAPVRRNGEQLLRRHDHAQHEATHLPSDVFSTPGLILEVDPTKQFNDLDGDGDLESD